MPYLIGLDNGGTTTKAALYDTRGRELAVAATGTKVLHPKPGFCERDMEEMWQANCTVLREVLAQAAIPAEQVAGIAVCGHGKGLYLWGKSGRPVRNGILSTDSRAYTYPTRWQKDGTAEAVFALSRQEILACQPVSLLAWLRDHEPGCFPEIRWIFAAKDYIRFRLTGQARAERTDYSGDNLMDLNTGAFSPALLECFGLASLFPALPPLAEATELCGVVTPEAAAQTGLRPGTPVAGGMFDVDACALAAGVTTPDEICMIAGTWSINEYLRSAPVTEGPRLLNSYAALPGYFLVEESSPTSAGNLTWFLEQVCAGGNRASYQALNTMVAALGPRPATPLFLPFVQGSNLHPNAKGCFLGLDAHHTFAHLVMSIYEGVAFSHRCHLDQLLRTRTKPPRAIRLAGGAARSEVWTQLFADVTNLPVERVLASETGTLGCAIAAAVATGLYPTAAQAVTAMCTIRPAVLPRPDMPAYYEKKYRLYHRFAEALDPLWCDYQRYLESAGSDQPSQEDCHGTQRI